ncbi:hypothetical protein ElyMa_002445800 [Elysia marginata]|uniref:Uncharacterized protein n=1 Tax=Elysia marginata TaxID=1093978 RepID=A0AAV4GJ92_9GAST|nr:hypothetical protein ElyMa_002445800 [Elysia marginata]
MTFIIKRFPSNIIFCCVVTKCSIRDTECSQGLGPNDNLRAATQRLAGILSLSRSHYTDTNPTSRGPDCSAVFRTRDLLATERSHYQLSYLGPLIKPEAHSSIRM